MDTSLKYNIPIYSSLPPILRNSINKMDTKNADESFKRDDLDSVDIIKIENSEPFLNQNNHYLIYIFILLIFIYLIKIYYFF